MPAQFGVHPGWQDPFTHTWPAGQLKLFGQVGVTQVPLTQTCWLGHWKSVGQTLFWQTPLTHFCEAGQTGVHG